MAVGSDLAALTSVAYGLISRDRKDVSSIYRPDNERSTLAEPSFEPYLAHADDGEMGWKIVAGCMNSCAKECEKRELPFSASLYT